MTYDTFFWWKANLQFSIWDFYKIFISKIKNRKRSIEFQGVSPPCMKNWIYFHIFINKFLSLVLKLLFLLINTFYAHNVFDIKRLVRLQTFIERFFHEKQKYFWKAVVNSPTFIISWNIFLPYWAGLTQQQGRFYAPCLGERDKASQRRLSQPVCWSLHLLHTRVV